MARGIRASFVCALLLGLMALPGCGGSGKSAGTGTVQSVGASASAGVGFNQARGFNEPVKAILPVPDRSGDVYVSGDFTTYSDQAVRRIVRLRTNGSLNPSFNLTPSVTGQIVGIAVADDGSGDVYLADITEESNLIVGRIRRIDSDGSIDAGFVTGVVTYPNTVQSQFPTKVHAVTPVGDGSGRIYVGGVFTDYNGTTVQHLVRVNPDGTLDQTFRPPSQGFAVFLVVPARDGSGDLYVASYDRLSPSKTGSQFLIRLNADGTQDPDFNAGTAAWPNGQIYTVVLAADGSGDIFVGGVFSSFGSQAVLGLARLAPNGAVNQTSPRPQVGGTVYGMAKANDGSGDWFVIQGFPPALTRYKPDGTIQPGFSAVQGPVGNVLLPAQDGSGDVYMGGDFLSFNGTGVSHLVRLNGDGTLDTGTLRGSGFDGNGFPISVAALRDGSGSLYASGLFTSYNGATANQVTRLTATGQRDPAFAAGSGFGGLGFRVIPAPARDGTGRLYVGGDFSAYDGQPVPPLVRLLSSGMRDTSFVSGFDASSIVEALAVAEDASGDFYAGGGLISYQGTPVNGAVRIHADGSLDRGFGSKLPPGDVRQIVPATDGSGDVYLRFFPRTGSSQLIRLNRDGTIDGAFVAPEPYLSQAVAMSVLRDGSGDIMVATSTADANGMYQSRLVRLNADGTIDAGFNLVSLDGFVYAVANSEQSDDAVYAGGSFTTANGTASPGIVRIDRNGILDPSFVVGTGFNDFVWSIDPARDGSGDIFVGGTFTKYKSTTMQGIARLNRDGSAD